MYTDNVQIGCPTPMYGRSTLWICTMTAKNAVIIFILWLLYGWINKGISFCDLVWTQGDFHGWWVHQLIHYLTKLQVKVATIDWYSQGQFASLYSFCTAAYLNLRKPTKSVPTRPGMGHANAKIGASRVLRWRYRHKLSPTNVCPP